MNLKLSPENLKNVCHEVPLSEIYMLRPLIEGMFEICTGKGCIGLAANQVGSDKRLFVINVHGFRQAIINPRIERTWGGVKAADEGCMSFPGRSVRVIRPKRCRVSGVDIGGSSINFAPKNPLICRVILHEYDHINGLTMVDRAKRPNAPYDHPDQANETQAA